MNNYDEHKVIALLSEPKTQRKAFEMVVSQYSEQLYWLVRRIVLTHEDSNDVMQNVFIKAWSRLDTFRNDSKLSTWLYRIAVNESLDFMRHQKSMAAVTADADESSVSNMLMADRYFDGDKAAAMLQQAISKLPEVQRMVFNMKYFDDMKYSEMSKVLNTSEGALKASYHIAVKKISEYFRSND